MSSLYDPKRSGGNIISSRGGRSAQFAQSDQSRLLPRQVSIGSMRGTQNIGSKGAQIDSANNRIVLSASDGGSVGIGSIPGDTTGQVGFFATDIDGSLLYKVVNGTLYFYNKDTSVNYMQIGVLPDGSTGMAVAKDGNSVADAITL